MTEPEKMVTMRGAPENIRQSFEMIGQPTDVSISDYLGISRVIIKNDPAIAKAFGHEAADEYEKELEASRPK